MHSVANRKKPCSTQASNTATVTGRQEGGTAPLPTKPASGETRATPPNFQLLPGDLRLGLRQELLVGERGGSAFTQLLPRFPLFKRQAASLLLEGRTCWVG